VNLLIYTIILPDSRKQKYAQECLALLDVLRQEYSDDPDNVGKQICDVGALARSILRQVKTSLSLAETPTRRSAGVSLEVSGLLWDPPSSPPSSPKHDSLARNFGGLSIQSPEPDVDGPIVIIWDSERDASEPQLPFDPPQDVWQVEGYLEDPYFRTEVRDQRMESPVSEVSMTGRISLHFKIFDKLTSLETRKTMPFRRPFPLPVPLHLPPTTTICNAPWSSEKSRGMELSASGQKSRAPARSESIVLCLSADHLFKRNSLRSLILRSLNDH